MEQRSNNYALWFIALALGILMALLWQPLSPFLYGIVLSMMLEPVVSLLVKMKLKRKAAIVVVTLFFVVLVFGFVVFMVPFLVSEGTELVLNLRRYITGEEARKIFNSVARALVKLGLADNKEIVINNILAQINELVAPFFRSALYYLVSSFRGIISVLLNVILVPLTVYYILKDKEKIIQFFNRYLSSATSEKIKEVSGYIVRKLKGYLKGLLLTSLLITLTMVLIFSLWGIEYAIILAVFGGIVSIIPYLGTLLQIIIIAMIQLTGGAPVSSLLWLAATQVAFYTLIALYIQPKLTNIAVKIHPLLFISSIMVGGYVNGIAGMIFSVPLLLVVQTIAEFHMRKYIQRI